MLVGIEDQLSDRATLDLRYFGDKGYLLFFPVSAVTPRRLYGVGCPRYALGPDSLGRYFLVVRLDNLGRRR